MDVAAAHAALAAQVGDNEMSAQEQQGVKGVLGANEYLQVPRDQYAHVAFQQRAEGTLQGDVMDENAPGQNCCNYPFPNWQENRRRRLLHLYDKTQRRRLQLIETGRDGAEGGRPNPTNPHTWLWCDPNMTPLYTRGPTGYHWNAMPAELQQQIKAIPLHAYVTWELTPWYQLETEHRTDYTPATGVNPGWNSGPHNTMFGGPGLDTKYPEDKVARSVGKFVSGGKKTFSVTDMQEWEKHKQTKEWRKAWGQDIPANRMEFYTKGREDGSIKNAFFAEVETYSDKFKPVCGFMMVRYEDAILSKKQHRKNIFRTQQAMFHPHSWKENVPFGPAIARLWWQWPGKGRIAGLRTAFGNHDEMQSFAQVSDVLRDNWNGNILKEGSDVQARLMKQPDLYSSIVNEVKKAPNQSPISAAWYNEPTESIRAAANMDSGASAANFVNGQRGSIFFGHEYGTIQKALDLLTPGHNFPGTKWEVVAGTLKSQLNSSMTGNILRWNSLLP